MNFTWSYSALTKYENCPRAYQWQYVQRNKEAKTEQQNWGEAVHKAMEQRAMGVPLPPTMAAYEKYGKRIDVMKATGAHMFVENKWAINRRFEPTGFFDTDVWGRAIADLAFVGDEHAYTFDYKTGKQKLDYDQADIVAAFGFIQWPKVQVIDFHYVWLQTGNTTSQRYERPDPLWQKISPRITRLETGVQQQQFEPRPSGLCAWCPVKTCEHWRPRR
jgi:hypothetical protein